MNKSIDEMNAEELGKLFPIIITEPNASWPMIYEHEKENLKKALEKRDILQIDHIGSTAVPGLAAKPCIDILIQIAQAIDLNRLIKQMESLDYHYLAKPENPPPGILFVKGYTPKGFRGQAFHVHIRYSGRWPELHFRDFLRKSADSAKAYAKLKSELAQKYRNDRDAYTEAKSTFIQDILKKSGFSQ